MLGCCTRVVHTSGHEVFQEVGLLLAQLFKAPDMLGLTFSDLAAGLVMVRATQKQREDEAVQATVRAHMMESKADGTVVCCCCCCCCCCSGGGVCVRAPVWLCGYVVVCVELGDCLTCRRAFQEILRGADRFLGGLVEPKTVAGSSATNGRWPLVDVCVAVGLLSAADMVAACVHQHIAVLAHRRVQYRRHQRPC